MARDEERRVLLTVALWRTREIAGSEEPPGYAEWARTRWREEREYGPRYLVGRWFRPGLPSAVRIRLRRALADLERDGLVTLTRLYGVQRTHVRLTKTGLREAERLAPPDPAADTAAADGCDPRVASEQLQATS